MLPILYILFGFSAFSLFEHGVYHEIIRGVCINEAGIDKQLAAINKACFHVLPNNTFKEAIDIILFDKALN